MIKFGGRGGKNGERRVIGMALSRRNLERLLANEPISFHCEDLGIAGIDVLLIAGETAADAIAELEKAAALSNISFAAGIPEAV